MYERVEKEAKENLKAGCEHLLYFTIDGLGSIIWRMNHDLADGRVKSTPGIEEEILEMREIQQFAVSQLERVGVEGAQDENNKPTQKYWDWYNTWKKYIDGLSDDDFYKLDKLSQDGTDPELSFMRPDPIETDRFNLIDFD